MSGMRCSGTPMPIMSWQAGIFTPLIHSVTGCSTCASECTLSASLPRAPAFRGRLQSLPLPPSASLSQSTRMQVPGCSRSPFSQCLTLAEHPHAGARLQPLPPLPVPHSHRAPACRCQVAAAPPPPQQRGVDSMAPQSQAARAAPQPCVRGLCSSFPSSTCNCPSAMHARCISRSPAGALGACRCGQVRAGARLQARVELQEVVLGVLQREQVLHGRRADVADALGERARAALHAGQHVRRRLRQIWQESQPRQCAATPSASHQHVRRRLRCSDCR